MTNEKAIIYCRVSSEEQNDPTAVSLDEQERTCREYAEAKDFDVVQVVSEVHSARTSNRPGLNQVRGLVGVEDITAVLVRDASRFMRNMDEAQMTGLMLQRYGATVHYVDRPPTGQVLPDKLLSFVDDWSAEQENIRRTVRMNRHKRAYARGGRVLTFDRPPYGYVARTKRNERGRIEESWLEVVEDQAKIVVRIFNEYASGSSMAAIAADLTEDGIPSYADRHAKMTKATHARGVWGRTSVRKILANETYIGRWHYNKSVRIDEEWVNGELQPERREMRPREEWIEVSVPPIIDEDTWQQVQSRLLDNHKPRHQPRTPHPLQGRVFCANCGRRFQRLTRRGRKTSDKVYVYWRCNGRGGKKGSPNRACDAHSVNGRALEDAVRAWVAGLALDPEDIQRRYDERLSAAKPLTAELERVDRRIEREQHALEAFVEQYAYGDVSKEFLDKKRTDAQSKIVEQRALRDELKASIGGSVDEDLLDEISYVLDDLRRYLAGADPDELVVPVEMVQDVYRQLDIAVRVDAMDPDRKSAVLISPIGSENVLL